MNFYFFLSGFEPTPSLLNITVSKLLAGVKLHDFKLNLIRLT